MKLLWPQMLWLAAMLPLLVAAYVLLLRKRSSAALRYASVALAKEAMRGRSYRRHMPPLLALVALGATLIAIARPSAVLTLASRHDTVILAIDVSGSMRAEDVAPNRLAAAQAAAKAFVTEQPARTRIGIVEFSTTASLVQPPTGRRADLERAIDGMFPQGATALGAAILVAVKAVFPQAEVDLGASDPYRRASGAPRSRIEPGSYKSAAVIVLADGESSAGPDAYGAARVAAAHGLRVYTVGFGTENGNVPVYAGGFVQVSLDEAMLRAIAELTGGEYLRASSAAELKDVYRSLHADTILERRYTEVTALFCAAALALLLAAGLLSLAWTNRPA